MFELQLLDGAFEFGGGFVEFETEQAEFASSANGETGAKIGVGEFARVGDDPAHAARETAGEEGGDEDGGQEGDGDAFEDPDSDGRDFRVDEGERDGEAERGGFFRNGQGDVEEVHAEGAAVAGDGVDATGEGFAKFGAVAVVFHAGGIGFGVGEDAAVAGDEGEAGPGGVAEFADAGLVEREEEGRGDEHAPFFGEFVFEVSDEVAFGDS